VTGKGEENSSCSSPRGRLTDDVCLLGWEKNPRRVIVRRGKSAFHVCLKENRRTGGMNAFTSGERKRITEGPLKEGVPQGEEGKKCGLW